MKKLVTLASILLFSLLSLISFTIIRPTTSSAQTACVFSVPNTSITRHGKVEFTIDRIGGIVDKDYLVHLPIRNVTIGGPWSFGVEITVHGPGSYGQDLDDLGLIGTGPIGESHEYEINMTIKELNPSLQCTPISGIIIKVNADDAVPDPNEPQFTDPPEIVNYGITTLDLIKVINVPVFNDADGNSGKVKFKLSGQWDDCCKWLREKGGDDEWITSFPTISITNICENGEANRTDCEEKFKVGEYKIEMVKAHNENEVLASHKFKVEVVLNEAGGPEGTEDLKNQVVTPFGTITATPEGLAKAFLSLGIGSAGGAAFLMMVFGAYRLIFAGGNPESIQEGRSVMTAAIAGLIVVILAVFLLDLIGISILGLDII